MLLNPARAIPARKRGLPVWLAFSLMLALALGLTHLELSLAARNAAVPSGPTSAITAAGDVASAQTLAALPEETREVLLTLAPVRVVTAGDVAAATTIAEQHRALRQR